MITLKPVVLAAALGVAACASSPVPVPVSATPEDLAVLAGVWEGQYELKDENRSGTIYFNLDQGTDVADGFVIMSFMMPQGYQPPSNVRMGPPLESERLAIRFVRASGKYVTGELERYSDPYCGCRLEATFSGVMRGDRISGEFTTRHIDTGAVERGSWFAKRQRPR